MKQHKRAWHETMRPRACALALGKCQSCGKPAEGLNGVIHHLKYPTGCYEQDVEDLMGQKVCQWLCRSCHDAIHVIDNFEEAQDRKKSGAHCKICGDLIFGAWDRARTLGIDYAICRNCLAKQKKEEALDKAGQMKLL
jgi:hypothetical protein